MTVFAHRPDSEQAIEEIAARLLRQAGASGTVPTDIDALVAASRLRAVVDPESFRDEFLSTLSREAVSVFRAAWEKIRGIADLRTRAIYVPAGSDRRRVIFPKAHELGHQVIPWQRDAGAYWDDARSLRPDAEELFDREANLFAAEVIFQGRRFQDRARSYAPSFEAVFTLAGEHGASRHSTLWRFVEEQDEAIAALPYWPSRHRLDMNGWPILRLGTVIGAPAFARRFSNIQLPGQLASDHPWARIRSRQATGMDSIFLLVDQSPIRFEWQAWWNSYTLFVLLRRKPTLNIVGRLIRP